MYSKEETNEIKADILDGILNHYSISDFQAMVIAVQACYKICSKDDNFTFMFDGNDSHDMAVFMLNNLITVKKNVQGLKSKNNKANEKN